MAQIDLATDAAPATPAAGRRAFYFDANGVPHYVDPSGNVHSMGGAPDVYCVTDYGLKGDDSTDNVTAMNALITTAGNGSPNGATIYFPAGTYRFASKISIAVDKRFRFLGSGRGRSILKTTSATDDIFNISVAVYYISFEELGFAASVTKTAGAGIVANQNNAYLNVDACEFQGMFNGLMYTSGAGNVGYISNSQFTAPAANGTQVTVNSTGINMSASDLTVNCTGVAGATGIRVSASGAFQLTGSDIIGGQNAFLIDQVGACQAIFCANTYFDQSTTGATVKITGSGGANRIKFSQCGITNGANGQNAMEISGTGSTTAIPDGIDIIGCDIYNNSFTGTTNGILITGARGVSVRNSRISGFTNGIQATSYSAAGITILDIQGNVIGPTENFSGNGTGILLNAGSFTYGTVNIQGNQLQGNTVAPINDASAVAATGQKIISGNTGTLAGSSAVAAATTFTADAVLAALTTPVPLGALMVGTTVRVKALVVGSAASTTMTLRVRCGTAGTTGDALLFSIALAGGATPVVNGWVMEGVATIRTLGSSGVSVGSGWAQCQGTTATANPFIDPTTLTSATVNTTVANTLTVSLQASTGTGTILSTTVEVLKS